MKLFINDEEVNFSTSLDQKDRPKIHQKIYIEFMKFYRDFNVANKGFAYLKFHKSLYSTGIFSDEKGNNERPLPIRPNSKVISLDEVVYFDGETFNVVCADSKQRDKDGYPSYIKTTLRVGADMTIVKEDKALIAFLALISSVTVNHMSASSGITFKKPFKTWFTFDNPARDAKDAMASKKRAFEVFNLVEKMKYANVERFAGMIGVDTEGREPDEVRNDVISMVETSEDLLNTLKEFNNTHNSIYYEVEESVLKARKSKKLSWTHILVKNKSNIVWGYGVPATNKNFKPTDVIYTYLGDTAEDKAIINYFVENAEAYNKFLLKLK